MTCANGFKPIRGGRIECEITHGNCPFQYWCGTECTYKSTATPQKCINFRSDEIITGPTIEVEKPQLDVIEPVIETEIQKPKRKRKVKMTVIETSDSSEISGEPEETQMDVEIISEDTPEEI